MNRIPLYLIALISAIANTPLHIYDVHAWNVGTVHAEPWRSKASGAVARACGLVGRLLDRLWLHRQPIAAIACAVLLLLLAPPEVRAHGVAICVAGHVTQLESDLKAKQAEAKALLEGQMRACEDHEEKDAAGKVVAKGRLRTDEEKAAVQKILDEAKGIKARIDAKKDDTSMLAELDKLTAGLTGGGSDGAAQRPRGLKSLGQQFVESESFAWVKKTNGTRQGLWTSPSAELSSIDMLATTLTEAAGGAALITTDYRPGILPYLLRPLTVADLLASGTTDSNSVSYMQETAPTNAAATVAEGAAKPESTLVFAAVTDTVRKIATWLPVTDEMLEDVAQIRSYIDERLRMFVQLAEDDQLLNGDGIAPNILGLRNRSNMQADLARGADTNADAIFKQMTLIAVNAFIQPDGTVMHPTNWQTIQLAKDANGQYYGQGPFAAPGPKMLWGNPVAVTVAMTAGVALPGAFKLGAQVFRRGGLRIEASNSHNDYFVKNLTAIRAEERAALAVYRPGGFGEVTGLN